nr:hypothetical protein [Hydrococcus rivularis]
MTQIVDRLHPQPLFLFGRGEKNVDRENLKIGINFCTTTRAILSGKIWFNFNKFSILSFCLSFNHF